MMQCSLCNAILSTDPEAYYRGSRVFFACQLLKSGHKESEVRKRVEIKYQVSKATAWRTVDIARDIYDS